MVDLPDDINGESNLKVELASLYVKNGIEMACNDVSGAILDPKMVHEARATELGFFKGRGSTRAYPEPSSERQRANSLVRNGSIQATEMFITLKYEASS